MNLIKTLTYKLKPKEFAESMVIIAHLERTGYEVETSYDKDGSIVITGTRETEIVKET